MNKNTTEAAHAHAIAEYPREACGLIVAKNRKEVYVPCRNMATTPSEHFVMSPEDYANAEEIGKVIGLFHSHPNARPTPSDADKTACETMGVPWHIASVYKDVDAEGQVKVTAEHAFKPTGWKAPLIGREFSFGVLDCFTLVQDWYEQELGIKMPTPERTDKFWERGEDLYMENVAKWGFTPIEGPIQRGDVIMMQIRSTVVNHAAVYLGDELGVGSSIILHHLYGHLSSRDVYGGYWAENTRYILRKTS